MKKKITIEWDEHLTKAGVRLKCPSFAEVLD